MEPGIREQVPVQREVLPQNSYETPTFGIDGGNLEKQNTSREVMNAASAEAVANAVPQIVLPQPIPIVQPTVDPGAAQSATSDDTVALIANDDDLIEKEWVDKAKKIIAETKDDPYRREVEIGKLQIEYIRKRYGREIGKVED